MGVQIHRLTITLALLFAATLLFAREDKEQTDSLLRLVNAQSVELLEDHGKSFRKSVHPTFLHNGTYLICDSALWNVEKQVINCYGNVKLLQDETELTSNSLDYFIEEDRAEFRGGVVQLQNKQRNILRTHNLDYNTRDSIAVFRNGASMKDEDGRIIESLDGTYQTTSKVFNFYNNVNMFADTVFIKTSQAEYDSGNGMAYFPQYIDFWNEGNMLSASNGWYNRNTETFFFTDKVHGLTDEQEIWCDSLYAYRNVREVLLLGNAQVQDTVRHSAGLAQRIFYQDTLKRVTMTRDAAVAMRTEQESKIDTIYFGADTLRYESVLMCDLSDADKKSAESRLADMFTDPVAQYRRQAAEAAAEAAKNALAEAEKNDVSRASKKAADAKKAAKTVSPDKPAQEDLTQEEQEPEQVPEQEAEQEQTQEQEQNAPSDSVQVQPAIDSSKVGFVMAKGNVKVYRQDIQLKCDHMRYCDLDSIARFYIDPVIWNDGNRQYTADSISVLVSKGGLDRASLMSNAFIITQEAADIFDQIKGAEVMAYFDKDSQLKRFDALGGANALFFLKENDELATVNQVSCKMLYALLKEGNIDRVHYYDAPHNDAFPLAQLPSGEEKMKGFNWQPENRPSGKSDITSLKVRPSQRKEYEAHPKTRFRMTDIYFPGYMSGVYDRIEESRIRKALAKEASESEQPRDSVQTAPADTLAQIDVPAVSDSLSVSDTTSVAAVPDLSAVTDSLQLSDSSAIAVAKELTDKEKAALARKERQEERELARQLRIARRDARWAELDARDAAKAAAKAQRKLEKQRAATRRRVIYQMKQDAKDKAKLEKYIERFKKQKARKEKTKTNINDERQEQFEPSGQRPQAVEAGGEVSASA